MMVVVYIVKPLRLSTVERKDFLARIVRTAFTFLIAFYIDNAQGLYHCTRMTTAKATASIEESARKENSYPVFDLAVCLEFAKIVKDLGGSRNPVKKSILARQIGLAETTPSFFQRISSAKSFGIINGWGSYHLTDIGKLYFYPLTQQAAEAAKLVMLTTPAVFALIIQRFDGEKLPSNEMIGNVLHQEVGIPDSWK